MVPLRASTTKSESSPDDPTAFVPSRPWNLPSITTWDDSRNQNHPTDSAEEAENEGESMPRTRKSRPPSLKAKVAVEAIKAHRTTAQIAQMFGVHPTQVGGWKKQALAGLPDVFGNGREQMRQQADAEKDELYKQIGQMKVELDFLKKKNWP